MYTWELKKYVEDRNYRLGGDELDIATSIKENPQLTRISFNAYNNQYEIWDNEGNHLDFEAMPYVEAKEKGLVKCKKMRSM